MRMNVGRVIVVDRKAAAVGCVAVIVKVEMSDGCVVVDCGSNYGVGGDD